MKFEIEEGLIDRTEEPPFVWTNTRKRVDG